MSEFFVSLTIIVPSVRLASSNIPALTVENQLMASNVIFPTTSVPSANTTEDAFASNTSPLLNSNLIGKISSSELVYVP